MPCDIKKIDSNVTGLAFAEEECLKELPVTPEWFELEPNSYTDFGGELTNIARAPIDPSRQRKKGTTTDLDASGGFNQDLTQSNLTRLMQGFFFADAREKESTVPLNDVQVPIASVISEPPDYITSSATNFKANDLIVASNFANAENNALQRVQNATTTNITVLEALIDEAVPPANAKLETVGFQFPTSDLDIVASSTSIALNTTATDLTTLGLNVGEWIFVGGDDSGAQFANNDPGYGRIKSIATNTIELDDTTWTPVTETGTGLDIQIFFGTYIRNENDPSLIKRRSYNLERTLGEDADGTQSEYLEGAVPNEFTLNVPTTDKVNADLTFVAMDNVQRDGATGVKSGNRNGAPAEDAFNTSSDIYRLKMSIIDPDGILNSNSLFAFVSEATIAINNGITPLKAIGTLGAFEANAGDFEVSGSLTAYFADVAAVQAVRNNSDVAFNMIAAQRNSGVVFDTPLLSLGGGRITVEKDSPITVPLDTMVAENPQGYTMSMGFLNYLPDVAMPE
jgi:hypothetical protein